MTNKEKYKEAFSVLRSSKNITLEVEKMANMKRKHVKKMVAAAAAVCIIAGGAASAYAADLGGIQTKLSAWIHGSEVEVDVSENGDGYTFTYEEDGVEVERGGGGVAIDGYGNERKLSAEEVLDEMSSSPDIRTDENGKVWVYFYDQSIDITDMFDEEGICRIVLEHDGEKIYADVTRESDGSYSCPSTNHMPEKDQKRYTPVN